MQPTNNHPPGLCHRRQWPEPLYSSQNTRSGVKCVVRVNNREYHTDTSYENAILASENAAMRAYLICRNFSVNDGKYPAGTTQHRGAVLQGMPVAIGTERRNSYLDDIPIGLGRRSIYSEEGGAQSEGSSCSTSGGSSPRTFESGQGFGGRQAVRTVLSYGGSRRR